MVSRALSISSMFRTNADPVGSKMARLENKVVLITGGGSGIGRATALLFSKEGAKICISDLDSAKGKETAKLIKKQGGDAFFVKADVSKAEHAQKMVEKTIGNYRRLDILFNNAGISADLSILDTREEDWDRIVGINLKGVFLGCKYALPHMIRRKNGNIINMSSVSGLVGSQNLAAYCASKGGVLMLTRAMACDLGPYGIRVNCICPSHIRTPMVEGFLNELPTSKVKSVASRYPLRRFGKPEEIANVALFLASEDSSFITGSAVVADGGSIAQTISLTEYAGLTRSKKM
jgi:NAD(P)-dependent dehydrogenase (short-subunit alcohol dehydrogenase family)